MSSQFALKTHQIGKNVPEGAFFIQSRGYHSGRPLREPIANCFILQPTASSTSKQTLYWLVYCLYKSHAFYPYLMGSVVPFLRLKQCHKVIDQAWHTVQKDPEKLHRTVGLISDLEKKQRYLLSVAENVEVLHEAIIMRLLHS